MSKYQAAPQPKDAPADKGEREKAVTFHAELPRLEKWLYLLTWCGCIAYCYYCLYKATVLYQHDLSDYFKEYGWWGRLFHLQFPKDAANHEWSFCTTFFPQVWPWFLGHVILGQAVRWIGFKNRDLIFVSYCVVAHSFIVGFPVLLIIIIHVLIVYVVSTVFQSTVMLWVTGVMLICTLNWGTSYQWMAHNLIHMDAYDINIQLMTFAISESMIRYTSFCHEKIKAVNGARLLLSVKLQGSGTGKTGTDSHIASPDMKKRMESVSTSPSARKTTSSPQTSPSSRKTQSSPQTSPSAWKTTSSPQTSPSARKTTSSPQTSPLARKTPSSPQTSSSGRKTQSSPRKLSSRTTSRESRSAPVKCPTDEEIMRGCKFSFLDALTYVLYFPTFILGPIFTFDEFYVEFKRPLARWTVPRLKVVLWGLAKCLFWMWMCEMILYLFYFNLLLQNTQLMRTMPLWYLAAVGYASGHFFQLKYMVIFGVPGSMARLDQLEPPPTPKCVARIYLYSDMWKYFDRGLYNFMKRHIYIPLGGSRHGVWRHLLAAFTTFGFVFVWHGWQESIFLWAMINFLGIALEVLGKAFARLVWVQRFEQQWLSAAGSRRVRALIATPHYAMSLFSVFYFLGGIDIGNIYVNRIGLEGWPVSVMTLLFFMYTAIQSSMEIENMESRRRTSLDMKQR